MVSREAHLINHNLFTERPMNSMYFFQAFLSFVKGMVGIFVPIYLYTIGFSIASVLLFGIGVSIGFLFFLPFGINILNRLGFKYTFLLSIIPYFLHIVSLNYVDPSSWLSFNLVWITISMHLALFWPAYHSEVTYRGSNMHRAKELTTLQVITGVFHSVAPFVGGLILAVYGYFELLILASILILIGTIPMFFSKNVPLHNMHFSFKKFRELKRNTKYSKLKKVFAAEGIQLLALGIHIWPLVLFFMLGASIIKLGLILTVVSFLSMMCLFYFSHIFDVMNKNETLKILSTFQSLGWFLKSIVFFFGTIFVYMAEMFGELILGFFQVIYMSIFYNNAKVGNLFDYIVLREFYQHTAKGFYLLFCYFVVLFMGSSIQVLIGLLVIGIITPFFFFSLKEEKL